MPAAAYSVFTRILGEDGLSEIFRRVSGAATAAFRPVKAFNQAVGEPKSTALGRVGAAVDGVSAKFRSGLGSISAWLPALGAIGSAATLGGLIEMTRHNAEAFEGMALSAEKLGVSTKDLAVWRYGAKMTGVEAEAMEKGLVKLKKAMEDAATGKNKDVALLFQRMKIPLRDANGQVKNVDKSLDDIAEAFKNTHDESVKSRAALALFGKAGADMLPFLNRGRAGIAAWREELKKYSNLSDENRKDLGELAEGYKRLDKAGSGLSMKLSAVFAPAMVKVVNWTTAWIVANRDLIAQSLERKLGKIGEAFQFVAEASASITSLPLVAEFWKGVDASTAFDVGLGLLGLTMTGPVLSALHVVTAAWWRMTAAVLANPIGATIAGLIVIGWSLAKNWDENMTAIRAAWDRGFGPGVWEIFKRFNGVSVIATAVNDLVKSLTGIDLGALLSAPFKVAWAEIQKWVKPISGAWHALDPMFAWMDRHTVPTPALQQIGQEQAQARGYGPGMVMPPLPAPAVAGPANQALPPQEIKVVLSGEIKAPPGSRLEAAVDGGRGVNVGRSMWDGGEHG